MSGFNVSVVKGPANGQKIDFVKKQLSVFARFETCWQWAK